MAIHARSAASYWFLAPAAMPDIGSWSNHSSVMPASAVSRCRCRTGRARPSPIRPTLSSLRPGRPKTVTLVAQSMGAFSAPLACDRLPVSELVLLNAMIPAPGETAGEWWGNTGQAEAMRSNDVREGRDPDAGFDAQTHFLHDLPPEVLGTADVVRRRGAGGLHLFETGFALSGWPDVPTTVLAGRDDRFFPYEFQRRLARERLGLEAEPLPGGHLLALSQPDALVARLLRDL